MTVGCCTHCNVLKSDFAPSYRPTVYFSGAIYLNQVSVPSLAFFVAGVLNPWFLSQPPPPPTTTITTTVATAPPSPPPLPLPPQDKIRGTKRAITKGEEGAVATTTSTQPRSKIPETNQPSRKSGQASILRQALYLHLHLTTSVSAIQQRWKRVERRVHCNSHIDNHHTDIELKNTRETNRPTNKIT